MARETDILAQRFGYGPGGAGRGFGSPANLIEALSSVDTRTRAGSADVLQERFRQAAKFRMDNRNRSLTVEQKKQSRRALQLWYRGVYAEDAHARLAEAVGAEVPFFDRLLAFWENHFTVSVQRGSVRPIAGLFTSMAIRPHILGRFEDLLLAAELHPAMILYLDLGNSLGPNSKQGKRRGKGLNENLAREVLELHTLGVDGGYTQQDVTEFAKIMTGWSVNPKRGVGSFQQARAEPGEKTLLGRRFGGPQARESDYAEALRHIATQPATARFIARKLVRHFISEDPPKVAVEKVASAFADSSGNLLKIYQALVELPHSSAAPFAKARNDYEFVVAALRTANVSAAEIKPTPRNGRTQPHQLSFVSLNRMQQKLWSANAPVGWSEKPEEWLGPTALAERLSFVGRLVPRIKDQKAQDFLNRTLGSLVSEQTAKVISIASSREEAFALVLASPEFNRR